MTSRTFSKVLFFQVVRKVSAGKYAAHSPWYRTVLRGTGFQLRQTAFSQPTRITRSKTFVPPMVPLSAPIRRKNCRGAADGGISRLEGLERAAGPLAACNAEGERAAHEPKAATHSLYCFGCLPATVPSPQYTTSAFFKEPQLIRPHCTER